jgi:hypothetical protein
MAGPTVYPVPNVFCGWAREATPGVPVPMTGTLGLEKPLEWNDKVTWLEDMSLRGVMTTGPFGVQPGVTLGELTFPESPVYCDSFGVVLGNIMGDLVVTGGAAPYTNAFALLNTAVGQPTTHTFEQYYGPTTTSGSRLFTASVFSEVTIAWDVAKKWLTWSGKANSWASTAAASLPVDAQSTVKPIPSWQIAMGLGGTAVGAPITTCQSGKITIKREVSPEYGSATTQNPYAMVRGALTVSFSDLVFITTNEAIYSDMINNSQPQTQFVWNVGSGATQIALQIDALLTAFQVAKPNYGGKIVKWSTSGEFVANTTNVGASGGQCPAKFTLTNAVNGAYV